MSSKITKRALVSSVIALVLCFTMLLGTTYAWFTDSVSASGNVIKSGTLNIDLGVKTKADANYVSVKADPTKVAFNYDLWEPGYTEWVNAKVTTTGNLALKYTMRIIANGTVSALANVIDVYYAPSEVALPAARPADLTAAGLTNIGTLANVLSGSVTIDDTLIPGSNDSDFATIALHMQESAGNEYQNLSIGTDFSLQILATQYTYEEDSFDDQYDANATFVGLPAAAISSLPVASVGTAGMLTTTYGAVETVPADTAFKFSTSDTLADIAGKDYEHWDCDFVVTFNQDVDAGDVYLFGQYDAFSATWQGATLGAAGTTVAAGTGTKLIKDWLSQAIPGVTVDYTDVVNLSDFNAAIHVDSPAAGLAVTVDLIMTDPTTGNTYVISTINYNY